MSGPDTAPIRAQLPEPDRQRFDDLLADARAGYAHRDDDVGICVNWPLVLVRRAALAAGRTLADRGRLAEPAHVFEAEPAETTPSSEDQQALDGTSWPNAWP